VDSVLVNNKLIDSLQGYTFLNVSSNQTIRVTFKKLSLPSYIPENGLVGWWPFNGNANDESGNGNHGTVNGATLTSDRFQKINSAYAFDGIDDFIKTMKTNVSGTGSRTYSIWFLSEKNVGQSNKILTDEGGTACGSGFATLQYPSNNIVFDNKTGSSTIQTPSLATTPSVNNAANTGTSTTPASNVVIPAAKTGTTHTIKKGDTLYAIAKANNTTVSNLVKANGFKNDKALILPGQTIKLK